jgi:hypothetical protein
MNIIHNILKNFGLSRTSAMCSKKIGSSWTSPGFVFNHIIKIIFSWINELLKCNIVFVFDSFNSSRWFGWYGSCRFDLGGRFDLSGMTDMIGSSPNSRVTWLILELCFCLECCLTFFLDLEVDAKRDAPRNDEVFEEEGGETVGNTAV